MLNIEPKINKEKRLKLLAFIDRRGGMNIAARRIGISRVTLRTTINSGHCSELTAEKIDRFLEEIANEKKHYTLP